MTGVGARGQQLLQTGANRLSIGSPRHCVFMPPATPLPTRSYAPAGLTSPLTRSTHATRSRASTTPRPPTSTESSGRTGARAARSWRRCVGELGGGEFQRLWSVAAA